MALNIKSDNVDRLARELTALTGESLTTAVEVALQERLERARGRDRRSRISRRLARLSHEAETLSVVDRRSAEEIIGYDEQGLPT